MSSILSAAAPLLREPASPQTAGAWLRQQRQQRGLHIVALAAMLKVPQSKLEALESDRLQELPDATFTRALATAMCRALKVDAAPVMAMLPRSNEPELNVSRGLNKPYRERDSRTEGLSLDWVKRPVVWGAGLVLLAAAAVYFLPADLLDRYQKPAAESAAAVSAQAEPSPVTSTEILARPAGSDVSPGDAAASEAMQPMPAASKTVQATAAVAAPMPAAVTTPSAVTASVAAAPAPVAGGVPLLVKVSAESWVEVVDARGQTLLSKLLRPGDVQNLSGLPPLKVRVGNVAGTELVLRGSSVDLASQSRDNVARIELN
ncbi:helix-turn-helix domain-containing protein [Paucibacter sp. AS339]|uniref:helix-turn-helix domain-containing protein n=1 Tax=Paucibacter hankyongi TaxID=3133434 RepID=UPI0030A32CCA